MTKGEKLLEKSREIQTTLEQFKAGQISMGQAMVTLCDLYEQWIEIVKS